MSSVDTVGIWLARRHQDHRDMAAFSARTPKVEFHDLGPECMEVKLTDVPGLHRLKETGEVVVATEHRARFLFTPEYPTSIGPLIVMQVPAGVECIVHPNIAPNGLVCYGIGPENYCPSVSMPYLCVLLARMLSLNTYNLASIFPESRESAEYIVGLMGQGKLPLSSDPIPHSGDADELVLTEEEA